MRSLRTGCCLVLVASVAAAAEPAAAAPKSAVESFYAVYMTERVPGLPSGAALEHFRPFMSEHLYKQIIEALEYQRQWSARHPDQPSEDGKPPLIFKPPFVDGDYFTSNFEGAESFKVASERRMRGDTWKVSIQFTYGSFTWQDAVIVERESNRYVVADIIFSGAGPFNPAGRLTKFLAARDE